jgi:LAO/AO transport system kinase
LNSKLDIQGLFQQLTSGDRVALGRAITLVESRHTEHRASANRLLDLCLATHGETFRFAISGAPGAGKSTLIEVLGQHIVDNGENLAVLTVDPSSSLTSGAILGDKTRMQSLSVNPKVFIRPTAAGDALGGVAESTREAIVLCEAAGYQNICIETVGVGQSEVTARSMTDFLLLLVMPGGGDDLQGIKRGIVEIADVIAVNKADGQQLQTAITTRQNYMQAAHFFAAKEHGVQTRVVNCSALENTGITDLWSMMQNFRTEVISSGFLQKQRRQQDVKWLESKVDRLVRDMIHSDTQLTETYVTLKSKVRAHELSVSSAYDSLSRAIRSNFSHS